MGKNERKIMSELLLELFSEEIPAMMQKKASIAYKDIFSKYLTSNGINFKTISSYASPRRLALHVTGLPTTFPKAIKERRTNENKKQQHNNTNEEMKSRKKENNKKIKHKCQKQT